MSVARGPPLADRLETKGSAPANRLEQTIALLESGGGYDTSEISDCFETNLALTRDSDACTDRDQRGQRDNAPAGTNKSAEATLDTKVDRAVVRGGKTAFYFAPFTEQGWVDIENTAWQDFAKMPIG
jgi:hypothetical protein